MFSVEWGNPLDTTVPRAQTLTCPLLQYRHEKRPLNIYLVRYNINYDTSSVFTSHQCPRVRRRAVLKKSVQDIGIRILKSAKYLCVV